MSLSFSDRSPRPYHLVTQDHVGTVWNDRRVEKNCVWVAMARFLGITVSQLEQATQLQASPEGADGPVVQELVRRVQLMWEQSHPGKTIDAEISRGPLAGDRGRAVPKSVTDFVLVLFEYTVVVNGVNQVQRHCVIQKNDRYVCYQNSITGQNLQFDTKKAYLWVKFQLAICPSDMMVPYPYGYAQTQ
jgi:hypothetical protein